MSHRYSLIPATREQVETIRKKLGTDEEDIKRTIASVRDWLRMQPHLPDEIEDARIERMYINCKCSIERVKKGLDAYFSLKTRHPEMMMNRDPRGPDVVNTIEHIKLVTMPRLTEQLYRVHIFGDADPDPVWVSWPNYGKIVSINLDMMLFNDYSLGDIVIVELKNLTAGHALRTDVNIIRAIEFGYKTAYCRSLKALHLINADKVTDFAMKILSSALSKKLQKRMNSSGGRRRRESGSWSRTATPRTRARGPQTTTTPTVCSEWRDPSRSSQWTDAATVHFVDSVTFGQ